MAEISKRLTQGLDIILPITDHKNVRGLQKEIKKKLPIVSNARPQPQQGEEFAIGQVWLDTGDDNTTLLIPRDNGQLTFHNDSEENLSFSNDNEEELTFQDEITIPQVLEENLTFGETSANEELMFGGENDGTSNG